MKGFCRNFDLKKHMRKLHDIHSSSRRSAKNNATKDNGNHSTAWSSMRSNSCSNNHLGAPVMPAQLSLSPTTHLTQLSHHTYSHHMHQQHQRGTSDYTSPFVIPSRQTPSFAKVFWQKYYVNFQSQLNYIVDEKETIDIEQDEDDLLIE